MDGDKAGNNGKERMWPDGWFARMMSMLGYEHERPVCWEAP